MTLGQAALAPASTPMGSRRVVPFDYTFVFTLSGRLGNITHQTVSVSIEASYTAVAIGYGLVPDAQRRTFGISELRDLELSPVNVSGLPPTLKSLLNERNTFTASALRLLAARAPATKVRDLPQQVFEVLVPNAREIKFGDIIRSLARVFSEDSFVGRNEIGPRTAEALAAGIRLNPELARSFLDTNGRRLDASQLAELFETVPAPPERLQFLYALSDQGSGREFQSAPVLSTAGMGSPDGERPFRQFAQPITFAARSVIRLDVTELSTVKGALHFSLHGYKVLGGEGTPTGRAIQRTRRR